MRHRILALGQVILIAGSMVAPAYGLAADPVVEPSAQPSASQPADEPGAAPPTAEPTAEPAPEPNPEPISEATFDPAPTAPAEPTADPAADPSPEPSEVPTTEPTTEPSAEPSAPASPDPSSTPTDTIDFVVTFASGTTATARADILAAAGVEVVDTIAPLRMAVIRVPASSPIVDQLRSDAAILHVERDRVREAEAAPNDPGYDDQWSLRRIGWNDVYGSVEPTGSAVVAVLDTGVDAAHADLAGSLVPGTSLLPGGDPTVDPNGHGTAMAGIIAAAPDNALGISGIGFRGVKVMPVTVLDADGLGQDSDIIEGIVWAVDHGTDVINLSFSNPGYSSALQAAVDYAWDHDVVVVAATGNDGASAPTYPAGDRGVIGVSNTNRDDELEASSNHGADTFLAAPGTDIATLQAGGGTTSITGTSASSAEVAGAAALLRALDPGASNGTIVGRLARSAAAVGTRDETGNGRLDLARAVGDDGTAPVKPEGAAPTGSGGPFVGPYVAASPPTVNPATTLNGSTGTVTVLPGATINIVMNVSTNGLTFNTWGSSSWAIAAAPPGAGSMTCYDHGDHGPLGTYTEAFTITAPAAPGTYNLYLYAYITDACLLGQSALFTRLGAVVVDAIAPTVTIDQRVGQADPTNASPINFTVTFSEPVVGFATGDVSFTGSTVGGALVGTVTGAGPTYNVAVTGMTGTGTVVASIGAGVAADPAGNANAASTSTDNSVTFDNVRPTVTIDQQVGQADPTNTSPILYTVTFSEPVTGFITGDVSFAGTAGGAKTGTVSGGPTVYTVSVTGMTTSGTVIATIVANRAIDLAGNNNLASTSTDNTVTWDVTAPTVTINQRVGQADPTSTSPILYTVTFSEPVTGFITGDVSFAGTAGGAKTGTVSGGPTVYTVSVTGMTTSGTVIATVGAGVATDAAGNNNAVSTSADNTVTWDVIAPTVTIDQRVGQADPTNASPINFTVTFSEPVVGFATGDVSFTGSTVGGALVGTVTGAGPTYNVAVTGMTGTGTVVASIGAGVAADPAGNANAASTSTDNSVTFDNVRPTVTIDQQVGQADPTNTSPILYTVTFSEPVTGFITGDVSFAGTAGGAKTGTVSGGPTVYTVSVTGMTTSGTVIATIVANRAIDLAGNNNLASTSTDNTVTWDVTAPTVTINQRVGQADPTSTSPILYTVTFSEPVTGFITGDVSFAGTAGGAKTGTVSGGPTVYTVSVTGMTTSGTVIATVGAGVATDAAGNNNAVSTSADNTVTWDVIAPTVTIDQRVGQADPTNASPINFTVTFSEPVVGFATGDVSFTGSTVGGALVGTVTGAGPTYNVAVTGMTGTGTVVASIGAGVAADPAGNANAASTSTDNSVTFDNVRPTVTIDQQVGQADPTNTSPILYTVTFSEPVTGFITGDVSFAGTAGGAKTGTVSGGPTVYTVSVTGMTTSGTVIATIVANRAIDLAGNNNLASTSTDNTVTWDVTAPTVTINQRVGQADPTSTSPILYTVTFSEPVTGFITGDVSFAGTAGGAKTGTVSGGPTVYTVSVTGMTTSGTVIATVGAGVATDAAGNNNAVSTSADNTVTWDVIAPTVTIDQRVGQADPTNASPINFTVTFSEPVVGFATGDVSFTGSTVGGALVGTVTGAGPTYNVAVTGMTGTGTVVASIGAGVAADPAGNANAASTSTDNSVTFDNVRPTVTIALQTASDTGISNADNITNAANPVFDLTFSEPVVGLLANDLSNVGTATTCAFGVPAGSGAAWTVTVTGCSEGTLIVRLRVNGVTDLAGNGNAVTNGATVTIDRTAPTVTINQAIGQPDPTNVSPIDFSAVFSEDVFGFATGDVTVGGSSGGVKVGTVSGGPTTYGVAVTGMTISGTVVASIAAAAATDTAGNDNTASTSADNTVLWFRATHVGFVQQPTDTIYRSTITPAVTIAILDASNNVVTESAAHGVAHARTCRPDPWRDAHGRGRQRDCDVQFPLGRPGGDLYARCLERRAHGRHQRPLRDHPGTLDHHRRRPDEDLWADGRVRGHRVHERRPARA